MIAIAAAKVVASIIQASGYHPRLQELAVNDSTDCLAEVATDSVTVTDAPSRTGADEAAEGEDENDEEEPKKKRTALDWPSTFLRFRRLLPFIFPGKSRLAYLLICQWLSTLLVPEQPLRFINFNRHLPSPGNNRQCCLDLATTAIRSDCQRSRSQEVTVA